MDTGSFYTSMTNVLSQNGDQPHFPRAPTDGSNLGSMYEFPFDPFQQGGVNQKLDRVVSLILEQKEVTSTIKREMSELRKEVASLMTKVSVSQQKQKMSDDSPTSTIRKKVPSQLSVSIKI